MRIHLYCAALCLLGLSACGDWLAASGGGEEEEFRPYASYGAADLEALATAYRAEVADLERRYEAAKRHAERSGGARDRELLDQQVDEFERVQRRGGAVRSIGAELSEREAALREIERELARKQADAGSWTAKLSQLFSSFSG